MLGRLWNNVYNAVPKISFPYTNLNISFSLVGALFLISVRIVAFNALLVYFGWPNSMKTAEAAGSVPSIVHSSLLCPGLIFAFWKHKYSPSEHISKGPSWWQDFVNALLQFCTGYMVSDAIFIVLYRVDPSSGSWAPALEFGDLLFLGHHFATTVYMTQARVYQAGHMSAMMCMLLGELSNPLHNTYLISQIAMDVGVHNNQDMHTMIETVFSAVYVFLRVVVAPLVLIPLTFDLLFSKNGRTNLPLAIRLFWSFMVYAVMIGSYDCIMDCVGMLQKNLNLNGEISAEL